MFASELVAEQAVAVVALVEQNCLQLAVAQPAVAIELVELVAVVLVAE